MNPFIRKILQCIAISLGGFTLLIVLVITLTDWSPVNQPGVQQASATRPMRLRDGLVD